MKLPNILSFAIPEDGINVTAIASTVGIGNRPTRRLTDITPASRSTLESEHASTSPKLHALCERFNASSNSSVPSDNGQKRAYKDVAPSNSFVTIPLFQPACILALAYLRQQTKGTNHG